jgi:hypothetical protein
MKEREFYFVSLRKAYMIPTEDITLVKMVNGVYAMKAVKDDLVSYKFIKEDSVPAKEKKYGKAKKMGRRRR